MNGESDIVLTPATGDIMLVVAWCLSAVIVFLLGYLCYIGHQLSKLRKANDDLAKRGVNRLEEGMDAMNRAARRYTQAVTMFERAGDRLSEAQEMLARAQRLSQLTQAIAVAEKVDIRPFDGSAESTLSIADWIEANRQGLADGFNYQINEIGPSWLQVLTPEGWMEVTPDDSVVFADGEFYVLESSALVLKSQ